MNSIDLTNIRKNPLSSQKNALVAGESEIDFGALVPTLVDQNKLIAAAAPSNGVQGILAELKSTVLSLLETDSSEDGELLAATEVFTGILAAFDNVIAIDPEATATEIPLENFPAILSALKNILAAMSGAPTAFGNTALVEKSTPTALILQQNPHNDFRSSGPLQAVSNALAVLDDVISSSSGSQSLPKHPIERPSGPIISQISDRLATSPEKSTTIVLTPLRSNNPNISLEKQTSPNPSITSQIQAPINSALKSQGAPKLEISKLSKTMLFDPRVRSLLSLVVKSTAAGDKATGSATMAHQFLSTGTEPAAEINFSEFKLPAVPVSEQDIQIALKSLEKLGPTSSKLQVENNQINSFSKAVTRQIQSVNVGQGRTVIQLAPNGLGNLEIDLQTDDAGSVHVIIRAENPTVLTALRNDRESVLEALSHALPDNGATDLSFQNFGQDSNERKDPSDDRALFDRDPMAQLSIQTDGTRQQVISNDHLDLMA